MKKLFSFTLVLFAVIGGCMTDVDNNAQDGGNLKDLLLNTEWELQSFGPIGREENVLVKTAPTMKFGQDDRITGRGSCNNYFASYEIGEGNALSVGMIGSTEMYCADEGVMDQEQKYFQALGKAATYEVDEQSLQIFDEDGQRVLKYVISTN